MFPRLPAMTAVRIGVRMPPGMLKAHAGKFPMQCQTGRGRGHDSSELAEKSLSHVIVRRRPISNNHWVRERRPSPSPLSQRG